MDRIRLVVFVVLLGLVLLLMPLLLWASVPPSGAYAANLPTAIEPAALARAAPEPASDVEALFHTALAKSGSVMTAITAAKGHAKQENQKTVIVRLSKEAYARVAGIQTVHTIDYGSFVWLELAPSSFEKLRSAGVEFELRPDATVLKFQEYRFDTRVEQPSVPTRLTSVYAAGTPGLYVVQLLGPTKDEWLADLKANGLEILQYIAPYSYLVRMTPEKATVIRESKSFVRWVGPYHTAYRLASDLLQRSGYIENVSVVISDDGRVQETIQAISNLGGKLVQQFRMQPGETGGFVEAIFSIDDSALTRVAQIDNVIWLGYSSPRPGLDDEVSDQIVVGNYGGTPPTPTIGYQAWLTSTGYDGTGVTWADVDSGMDTNNNATAHQDIRGRIAAFVSYAGAPATDTNGHGTHTGGIIAGNATLGTTDANGFLLGLGVAPGASLVVQNALSGSSWPPAGGWQVLSRDSVINGAIGSNNSWYTGEKTAQGYSAHAQIHDRMVRDANFDTATTAEPLIMVFSAGNEGPGASTITEPKEAKNLIVVGASENFRSDTWVTAGGCGNPSNINNIMTLSSRGPALDGRILPNVVAPGSFVASLRSATGSYGGLSCSGVIDADYVWMSGTSMAAPHASGGVALITQWWRTCNAGVDPLSPAMAKALLINGAEDMGTADIPNNNEGWGRINLDNVINVGVRTVYIDQPVLFHDTGDIWTQEFVPADPNRPVKVTLVWSDAPANAGASPAWVNDLDLVVTEGATTYRGNVFAAGWSTPGGTADNLNNIENVYIQNPAGGYTVTVSASHIGGDGVPYNGDTTDQDFALVIQNAGLVVNSTADTGDGNPGDGICDTGTILSPTGICTLRAAIEEANATVCVSDTIRFNIPLADPGCNAGTGVCTIQPLSALPVITNTVMIDGYSQLGAAPATATTNADLKIVLDGSNAGNGVNGLEFKTDSSTVRGLNIHGFRVTKIDHPNQKFDFTHGNGIVVREGMTNTITGNFIGTNVAGTACVGNGGSGVLIGGYDSTGDANNNTIGGTDPADRNVITCNGFQRDTSTPDPDDGTGTGGDGVTIWANYETGLGHLSVLSNTVVGNYIGTNVTGAMTLTAGMQTITFDSQTVVITHTGNTGSGVRIAGGSFNTVGGTTAGERNIISGNELAGVRIEAVAFNDPPTLTSAAISNTVQGNYIGTDVNGTADLGNLDVGVYIIGLVDDADSNQIGGTTAAERNLISGNGASGVFIFGGLADNNTVSGNYIGTNVSGTSAIPNDSGGVLITDAEDNNITDNLISGNAGIGVSIINSADDGDADGNVIQSNYIGTEVSGTAALSNTLTGVVITDAANNDVGGTDTGAGNLISGNGEYGVIIMESGATGNDVQGNYIGTDFDGDAAIPNQGAGVMIVNASSNTVGGSGNLISGNVLQGVRLIGADNNAVRDNLIGTQADGTSPLGNGSHGVVIADSDDNIIGVDGVTPQDNTIAHNGGDGVLVLSGTGNQILSNSIFSNTELGIDLGTDNVVTPNDEDDPDTGANNLQNYPVLTTASIIGGPNTNIQGVLNSTPSTQFTIQFFANTACELSGFGEGRTYLATDTTTTDGAGDATTSVTVAGDLTGQFITATATDPNGNTSEFSNCVEVGAGPVLTINKEVQDLNGGAVLPGDTLLYTINYSNTGNAPATGVLITDDYSARCATISNVSDGDFPDHDDNGDRIRWPATGGILINAQASGSVSYRCTLQASFPAGTNDVENTATIDSDQTTPQQDTETVPVTVEAVLTIDKECTPATGNSPGDTVHCVIQYANTGDAYATGATIEDDYDETAIFSITNFQETGGPIFGTTPNNNGDRLRWPDATNTVTVPAGASGSVSYDATLQGPGTFPHGTTPVTNTATIDSNDTDPVADPETIQVTAAPVLTIGKQGQDLNGGLAQPGDILRYTINYANTGNAPATGVFITDDYSDLCAISGVTTDANFPTFSNISGVLRWPHDPNTTTLAAGASGSLSYDCTVQDPLPLGTTKVTNTGTIDSDETGPEQDTETLLTACFDFNGNGEVDIGDVMAVAVRWGLTAANPNPDGNPSTPNYEAKYDANEDGVITVVDIMMVAAQWGQTCP